MVRLLFVKLIHCAQMYSHVVVEMFGTEQLRD